MTLLLDQLRKKSSVEATSDSFREFWQEFLDIEKANNDKVRDESGWAYTERRWGLGGAVDFFVGDSEEEIGTRKTRLRLQLGDTKEQGSGKSNNNAVFELRSAPAKGWVAAAPVRGTIQLDQIPGKGKLQPDWIGLDAEYRRRENAFKQLRAGETAMPGLNGLLPYGPKIATTGVSFEPLLRSDYDLGQKAAIESALTPNNITAIMGPPGTGKTSVIAEIAAQVVKQGGRVLIASQSNLAVDNALEKIASVENIFAVRIGNPEAVKINKQLLMENAADRYRRMLLEKSTAALNSENCEVEEFKKDPSEKDINTAAYGAIQTAKGLDNLRKAKMAHDEAADGHRSAEQALAAAEQAYQLLVESLCLSGPDVALTLRVAGLVRIKGWNISDLGSRQGELIDLYALRGVLHDARQAVVTYREDFEAVREMVVKVAILERRIKDSKEVESSLAVIKQRNDHIEQERATSTGWNWLKSHFVTWKSDTGEIESQICALDRSGAQCELPTQESRLAARLSSLEALFEKCGRLAESARLPLPHASRYTLRSLMMSYDSNAGLFNYGGRIHVMQAVPQNGWNTGLFEECWPESLERHFKEVFERLEQAEFLEENGALGVVHAIPSASEIVEKQHAVKLTGEELANATEYLSSASECLTDAHRVAESVNSKVWFAQLDGITRCLYPNAPGDDTQASALDETSIRALATLLQDIRHKRADRLARFERLKDSLGVYHSRLGASGLDLDEAVLEEANVVAATCSGIAGTKEFDRDFDFVIVDEAGRATPLDLLMPLIKGRTIVLVGDHRQLPPTIDREVQDLLTDDGELKETLFQKLFDNMHASRRTQLLYQYRMAPSICGLVKALSYADVELNCGGEALLRHHPFGDAYAPVHWIQCVGEANRAVRENNGKSQKNDAEVLAAMQTLQSLAELLAGSGRNTYSVGLVSMYRGQVNALERSLPTSLRDHPIMRVELGTVDAFQGREKDAMIVSLVGTDPNRQAFFQDFRRLNVALSRARELLVIIGSVDVLGKNRRVGSTVNAVFDLNILLKRAIGEGTASSEVFYA